MKTDFPRGPTLPLRGIGLEKPKWPESRDKKGPLNGGPEKRAEAGSPLRAPPPTLPAPPHGSVSARPGRRANHRKLAAPLRPAVPKPVSRAPLPDPRSVLGALARGFPVEGPTGTGPIPGRASRSPAPGYLHCTPSLQGRLGSWPCPVSLSAGSRSGWRTSAQTAESCAGWPRDRTPPGLDKVVFGTLWAPPAPSPQTGSRPPPPSVTSSSFVLSNFLRP